MSKTEIKDMIKYHSKMMIFYYERQKDEAYTEHLEKRFKLEQVLFNK
jgi:Lhr-like helicase